MTTLSPQGCKKLAILAEYDREFSYIGLDEMRFILECMAEGEGLFYEE